MAPTDDWHIVEQFSDTRSVSNALNLFDKVIVQNDWVVYRLTDDRQRAVVVRSHDVIPSSTELKEWLLVVDQSWPSDSITIAIFDHMQSVFHNAVSRNNQGASDTKQRIAGNDVGIGILRDVQENSSNNRLPGPVAKVVPIKGTTLSLDVILELAVPTEFTEPVEPTAPPRLSPKTITPKLPEGGLGGREDWFKDRIDKKSK